MVHGFRGRRLENLAWLRTVMVWAALFASWGGARPCLGQVDETDWTMYRDPELKTPELEVVFPPDLVDLWLEALQRPELEMRRRAAAAIRRARQRNVPGLEKAVPQLMDMVAKPNQDRMVQLTVVQTLVALDAKQSASVLFDQLAPTDLDMAELVEPALARWSYAPAREMWLDRLDAKVTFHRLYLLAMEGLTEMGEARAIPKFRKFALDSQRSAPVRLAAAEGLGQLKKDGLEEPARELIRDKSAKCLIDRLVAAKMLTRHRGDDLERLLAELAADPVPSVQAIALRQLFNIDPELLMPRVDQALNSSDVNVRRIGCRALIEVAREPRPDCVALLSPLLCDPNPTLRRYVCDSLIGLARMRTESDGSAGENPSSGKTSFAEEEVKRVMLQSVGFVRMESCPAQSVLPRVGLVPDPATLELYSSADGGVQPLRDMVITEAQRVLGQDNWRGQEQAIRLLVALDEKTIADRLVELLESKRQEVHTTAAWGLCQLNVASTIENVYSIFAAQTDQWRENASSVPGTDTQLAHLAQFIGRRQYMPADNLLREYVPKQMDLPPIGRAAAIWALGYLHAGEPDAELVRQLSRRLTDTRSREPEHPLVRRMSAVSLGRMKAADSLPALRSILRLDGVQEATGMACAWAIHQITAEPLRKVEPVVHCDHDWFLVPERQGNGGKR